jgi:hypothetical protein
MVYGLNQYSSDYMFEMPNERLWSELGSNDGEQGDWGCLHSHGSSDLEVSARRGRVLQALTPFGGFLLWILVIAAISLLIDLGDDSLGWITVSHGVRWLDGILLLKYFLGWFLSKSSSFELDLSWVELISRGRFGLLSIYSCHHLGFIGCFLSVINHVFNCIRLCRKCSLSIFMIFFSILI